MRRSWQFAVVAALVLALPVLGDDVVTNLMSSVVAYQYPGDFSAEGLTNGGVQSPLVSFRYLEDLGSAALTEGGLTSLFVSYQYFERPGNDALHLNSSAWASYYYQFLGAPTLVILSTNREATVVEKTGTDSFTAPSGAQLKIFVG